MSIVQRERIYDRKEIEGERKCEREGGIQNEKGEDKEMCLPRAELLCVGCSGWDAR